MTDERKEDAGEVPILCFSLRRRTSHLLHLQILEEQFPVLESLEEQFPVLLILEEQFLVLPSTLTPALPSFFKSLRCIFAASAASNTSVNGRVETSGRMF